MPTLAPASRRAWRWLLIVLALVVLASCDASPSLVVVLRSDLVPGVEVDQAVVSVELADGLDAPRVTTPLEPDADLLGGVRVLDLSGVPLGTTRIDVDLRVAGRVVAQRRVIVEFTESRVFTVVVTRSCETVSCPGAEDSAERTECFGGRCVDPRCTPETPERCVPAECDSDGPCEQSSGCLRGFCDESGVCLQVPEPDRCGSGERCTPQGACVPDMPDDDGGRPDGGTPDGGAPGDGGADAGPGDDAGGVRCTDPADCEDSNACTDDACVMGDCQNTPNSAACDDMIFCNGLDQCGGGSCSVHGGDPCTGGTTCDEAMDVCLGCTTDAECGMDEFGSWGSCVGFTDTCDTTGTQTRTTRTWACVSGSCRPNNGTESRPCTRVTNGTTCMATSCGGYGACSYAADCDTTGSRTRTCTDYACSAGMCAGSARTETDTSGCGRSTLGMVCGAGTTCGGYGACSYGSTCATSGTRTRTCTDRTCSISASCVSTTRSESTSSGCGRSTNGNSCGAGTTCGGWGACSYASTCANTGSRMRTCTDRSCSGGSCGSSMRTETDTAGCDRNTNGNSCNDGDACTGPDRCNSGMCFGLPDCRPTACPGPGCFPLCTGNCVDSCECGM